MAIIVPKSSKQNLCGEFFGTLLQASVIAHQYHLESKSYAQHMALGSLYEDLPGMVDGLAEAYQGCEGKLISGYKCVIEKSGTPLQYVENLKEYVISASGKLFTDPIKDRNLINEVDTITSFLDSVIYKLTFLS